VRLPRIRSRQRGPARTMPQTRHCRKTGAATGHSNSDQQKAANWTAIVCATITAIAAIVTAIITATLIMPPAVTVNINTSPQAIAPISYPAAPPSVFGSPDPVPSPVTTLPYPSPHGTPPATAPDHPSPSHLHPKRITRRHPQIPTPASLPALKIAILNRPGLLGALLAPLQLEWAAAVTAGDRAVEQDCSISWTLYRDGTPDYLGTTDCNGSFVLNSLFLGAGSFKLVGDASLPSGNKTKASADLIVQG
jgi:hypothetical protein